MSPSSSTRDTDVSARDDVAVDARHEHHDRDRNLNASQVVDGLPAPPHVAIVGGGPAGIAAGKALTCRGISCVLFEGKQQLGGLWVTAYPGAATQTPKHLYEFPETRFPSHAAPLATAADVCEYCAAYATQWHLWPHIRLSARVQRISRSTQHLEAAAASGGGFVVEYVDMGTGVVESEGFTHVIHATGLCSSRPHIPDFPGLESFAGTMVHSSQRRDDVEEFNGKNVVVIGNGKSAQDAALASHRAGATSVTLSMRTPHWTVPVYFFGVLPYFWILHNRVFQKACIAVYPAARLSPTAKALRAAAAPLRWVVFNTIQLMCLMHYRTPRRLWPQRGIYTDWQGESACTHTVPYQKVVRSGRIRVEKATVERISQRSVTLKPLGNNRHRCHRRKHQATSPAQRDGEDTVEVDADTVVLATGYEKSMQPFDDKLVKELQDVEGGVEGPALYKHMVHPSVPDVFFCGSIITISGPLTFSMQAAWIAEHLLGTLSLPTRSTMHAELALMHSIMRRDRYPSTLSSKSVNVQGDQYNEILMRDMHVDHLARYGGIFGPVANALIPQYPVHCENAVRPAKHRSKKMLRPPRALKAAVMVVLGLVAGGVARRRRDAAVHE